MHWLENALANVNIEALNDILVWTIETLADFQLNIGNGTSVFETTIPISNFNGPIFTLAYFIIVLATCIKLWITMMSPFDQGEEPGAIALRFIGAGVGVAVSQRLFMFVEENFNRVYVLFSNVYDKSRTQYLSLPWNALGRKVDTENTKKWQNIKSGMDPDVASRLNSGGASGVSQRLQRANSGTNDAFNLFGGDSLLQEKTGLEASLGVLVLELVIGCTLIISFFRLILEVYERYILLGVMYFTAPLAFSSIVSKDSKIFKSWMEMLVGQFILMCANLLFISGFILAWHKIMAPVQEQGYVYKNAQEYFTTTFCLIGWLIIGQKFDQHLKGLGLSTSQTGAGIMGALAGGAVMARTALGVAGSALGTVGGGARKAANGQLMEQKAMRNGEGLPGLIGNGGLTGASKNDLAGKDAFYGSGNPVAAMGGTPDTPETPSALNDLAKTDDAQSMFGKGVSDFNAEGGPIASKPMGNESGEVVGSMATYVDANGSGMTATYGTNLTEMKKAFGEDKVVTVQNSDGSLGGVTYQNVPGGSSGGSQGHTALKRASKSDSSPRKYQDMVKDRSKK